MGSLGAAEEGLMVASWLDKGFLGGLCYAMLFFVDLLSKPQGLPKSDALVLEGREKIGGYGRQLCRKID